MIVKLDKIFMNIRKVDFVKKGHKNKNFSHALRLTIELGKRKSGSFVFWISEK